jgi:hypothetical protein
MLLQMHVHIAWKFLIGNIEKMLVLCNFHKKITRANNFSVFNLCYYSATHYAVPEHKRKRGRKQVYGKHINLSFPVIRTV